jgi:hypothetical protein
MHFRSYSKADENLTLACRSRLNPLTDPSDAEKRAACTGDVMRLCFSKIGNMDRIEGCLRAHRPQLSGTCKALFDKYDSISGQKANSASQSPTTIEASVSERAPTVAQPANEKPAATPGSPAETARPLARHRR